MTNSPAKYEVLIKQCLHSILDISGGTPIQNGSGYSLYLFRVEKPVLLPVRGSF